MAAGYLECLEARGNILYRIRCICLTIDDGIVGITWCKMNRPRIVIACGAVLLIAAAVVVALRERQPAPLPDVPVAQTPAEVRVKAVE